MEVYLYNSTVCRLCGEENDNGTLLYSGEENSQNLSEIINTYLPIKVSDDEQLPRTICPGCTIQLEATVEFLNLIISGQKVLRELHQREKEYKKSIQNSSAEQEVITEKIIYEVNTSDGVYQMEHPIALQVAGLDKPKRKRGRPPKKIKTPEEQAMEVAIKEKEKIANAEEKSSEPSGKRRRKTPTRFREVVQGKELEKIFIAEGLIDRDEIEKESLKADPSTKSMVPTEPEVIGHLEESGELVVMNKGKGRGRPKGRMRPLREQCAICGMHFSCAGRYMAHVAQHGPVRYQCATCACSFSTKITFNDHQALENHSGLNVMPCEDETEQLIVYEDPDPLLPDNNEASQVDSNPPATDKPDNINVPMPKPFQELNPEPVATDVEQPKQEVTQRTLSIEIPSGPDVTNVKKEDTVVNHGEVIFEEVTPESEPEDPPTDLLVKKRLNCNHCDKTFASKQSKSLHIKATHRGERPHACAECGARFAYPRSLAVHALAHRRRTHASKGYACDLCGKVLNHPSSVVYHKEAEHAKQRYVCGTCGKHFKHRQLLQRHQLVHSALRPYACKSCPASFKTKANLVNHQLLHSGVKKYSCELCKQKFSHKTSLTLHMRWHTGQKPFSCETCGKSFSQKGNLSEHERIHTGEKPFQCEQCPRRFTTSSQHRLHARRHKAPGTVAAPSRTISRRRSGGTRHICSVCSRSFGERWALLKHMRSHTGERPFKCSHCPRAFADSSNLSKHKKQVHKQISLLASSQQQKAQKLSPKQQLVPQQQLLVQQQLVQQQLVQQQLVQQQLVQQQLVQQPKLSVEVMEEDSEERVIYVTYDADGADSPPYQVLDPEQVEEAGAKLSAECSLYAGSSMLAPLAQPHDEQMQDLLGNEEHVPVTDEQGNPLHFTMQDGTRLAITSADGKSLQVITQDGQTIPVEINGYEEEEVDNEDTIVHQLNLQSLQSTKTESEPSSPVTHYFTIV